MVACCANSTTRPSDFGRIATMTPAGDLAAPARATDEAHFGEYAGRDGDLVTGVISAHEGRAEKGIVSVDLARSSDAPTTSRSRASSTTRKRTAVA